MSDLNNFLYSDAIKAISIAPAITFVVAWAYESGYFLGLGLSVSHYYEISDFLRVSILYSPLALLVFMFRISQLYNDSDDDLTYLEHGRIPFEHPKAKFLLAMMIFLTLILSAKLYFIRPILPNLYMAMLFLAVVVIPFTVRQLTVKFLSERVVTYSIATIMFLVFIFFIGLLWSSAMRIGSEDFPGPTVVYSNGEFSSAGRLIRRLSSGVLLQSEGIFVFIPEQRVISISTPR